jgi:hypothetical protein
MFWSVYKCSNFLVFFNSEMLEYICVLLDVIQRFFTLNLTVLGLLILNATFIHISVTSWRSVLMVDATEKIPYRHKSLSNFNSYEVVSG